MRNTTASRLFHSGAGGIATVLQDVISINSQALRQRTLSADGGSATCRTLAGGVKLKLGERDVIFGAGGNAQQVADELRKHGYHVLLLQRNNHLDNVLSRQSRKRTGVLHCSKLQQRGSERERACDPSALNTSLRIGCAQAKAAVDKLRLRKRASKLLFSTDEIAVDEEPSSWSRSRAGVVSDSDRHREASSRGEGSAGGVGGGGGSSPEGRHSSGRGRVLIVDYEKLVASPRLWLATLRLLRLPVSTRCLLRDEHQKRVVQTQREMVRNYDALSTCFRRAGAPYERLLTSDRRPSSGVIPRDSAELCPAQQDRTW